MNSSKKPDLSRLTATLRSKVESNPTQTILRSESPTTNENFIYYKTPRKLEIEVPDQFNGKEVWSEFLSPVLDQGKCGSCWAFATAACLADRFNIHSGGKVHIQLSPARMVLCNWQDEEFVNIQRFSVMEDIRNVLQAKQKGCYGNSLIDAWTYLFTVGTSTESCTPYKLKDTRQSISEFETTDDIPLCIEMTGMFSDMCNDFQLMHRSGKELGTPARFYRCYQYFSIPGVEKDGGDEKNIRMHIYKYGPVTTGFMVYSDFYTFDPKTTIYKWDGNSPFTGGHAVEIVGWGSENGTDYWLVRNSWGPQWGIDGYFKIIRGTNECDIESNVMSGLPDFWFPYDLKYVDPKLFDFYWKGWEISKEVQMERLRSDTGINQFAGGVSSHTGYTRRVETLFPNIDFTPPLNWKTDTPDYMGDWKASDIVSKNYKGQFKSEASAPFNFTILGILVLVGLIIFVFFKIVKMI